MPADPRDEESGKRKTKGGVIFPTGCERRMTQEDPCWARWRRLAADIKAQRRQRFAPGWNERRLLWRINDICRFVMYNRQVIALGAKLTNHAAPEGAMRSSSGGRNFRNLRKSRRS